MRRGSFERLERLNPVIDKDDLRFPIVHYRNNIPGAPVRAQQSARTMTLEGHSVI